MIEHNSKADRRRVVVGLTTHERVDCARINMEILKLNYADQWPIVHACSGSSYELPHMEDVLVRCDSKSIIDGALNLVRRSFHAAIEKYNPDYLIHLDADTWFFDQGVLQHYIDLLDKDDSAVIAASSWSTDQTAKWRSSGKLLDRLKMKLVGPFNALGIPFGVRRRDTLSTQFFIIKNDPRMIALLDDLMPVDGHMLETDFYAAVVRVFGKRGIINMVEREPVHPNNRHWCPAMKLHCQHWPEQLPCPEGVESRVVADGRYKDGISGQYEIPGKKDVLKAHGFAHLGPAMRRLLESDDLSYYNLKAKRY